MTIYYVNPETGNNTNTGLSWAQAWQSLRGLRENAVVPAAGDELRFAKSPEFVPTNGQWSWSGQGQAIWDKYGVEFLNTFETIGVNLYRTYTAAGAAERFPLTIGIPAAGTITPGNPAVYNQPPLWANAPSGEINTPNTELFGCTTNISAGQAAGRTRVYGQMRCRTAYSGPGDQDVPAGALALVLKSYGTIVRTIPLPTIRNSTTEWTPFEIDFTALPSSEITELRVARTAMTLTRDSSPFGLELSELVVATPAAVSPTQTVWTFGRTSYAGGRSEEVVGSNSIRPVGEVIDPLDAAANGGMLSIGHDTNARTSTTPAASLKAFLVPELPWVGTGGQSPSGSLGAFDLNGSTGGTVGNPIRLTGGWNTGTDTRDGFTAFSGGLSARLGSSFAFLDLNGADYVKLEDITAAYGFSSLFTRGKNVHLLRCTLPFSISPAFGVVSTDTHITLETMYVAPILLEGYGVMGDLTLLDTFYASAMNSTAERRCEVRHLTMTNSQMGRHYLRANVNHKTTYCRGNALLDQCCLSYPPRLVSIEFGHTLVFQNHKPFTGGTYQVYLIPTAPESRWDHIYYSDETMPSYGFYSQQPTQVTCDAKVSINSQMQLWSNETAAANFYPTALRGNHVSGQYVDGIAYFGRQLVAPLRGTYATWETMTAHLSNRVEAYPGVHPAALLNVSDVALPPWSYRVTDVDPWTLVPETDPDIAPTGRIWLSRRFDNVSYRTEDTVFVCTMAQTDMDVGQQWITVKGVYVPKAGLYRAQFGFMGENLDWYNGSLTIPVMEPLTLRTEYPSAADGRQLGSVGVASAALVGLTIERPYYAATAADLAAGGGNRGLSEWRDIFIDFEVSRAGMVELRVGSALYGNFEMAIFDTLAVYERT